MNGKAVSFRPAAEGGYIMLTSDGALWWSRGDNSDISTMRWQRLTTSLFEQSVGDLLRGGNR